VRALAAAAASEPESARLATVKQYQHEMDKLAAIRKETLQSLKALALEKFEGQLRDYQAQLDAELRTAR
jgi:hypothetical protein